jgi:hypothetical protein
MRNLRDGVRRRNQARIKRDAQRIYLARDAAQARRAFRRFCFHWRSTYPSPVRRLERDLPELLTFFDFPRPLWRKLRTTNAIERCFVEVRRRTRPMVLFTNMQSVERILYAIFYRFNEQRVRAVLAARTIRVRAVLAARAIRVRAVLAARAIIVGPHPPPFCTSSLTSPKTSLSKPRLAPSCKIEACPKQNLRPLARSPYRTATKRPTAVHSCPWPLKTPFRATTHLE